MNGASMSMKGPSSKVFSAQPSLAETEVSVEFSSQQPKTFDLYPVSDIDLIRDKHDVRLLHFLRHAEGTHNVNKEYRSLINLDARLTEKGKEQCAQRAASSQALLDKPDLVVTSPLTRCVQTALLSFPQLSSTETPFVAHESIRETVNYSCDRRRLISEVAAEYPRVDFGGCDNDHDAIWESYHARLGSSYDDHRESAELHVVAERGRSFFSWLSAQEQAREVVVCSHSAFMRCLFGFGQDGGVLDAPPQDLDARQDPRDVPVFRYCGKDDSFQTKMRADYANCEMRSFLVAFPQS